MHDPWHVGMSSISHLFDQERVRAVARVRMGVHWLNADRVKALPRSQRVCKCCRLRVREDELHLLECPVYADLRQRHGIATIADSLADGGVWSIMNGDGSFTFWNRFAIYIIACMKRRGETLQILEAYLS